MGANTKIDKEQYIKIEQAAVLLNVAAPTARRYAEESGAILRIGTSVRIDRKKLFEYYENLQKQKEEQGKQKIVSQQKRKDEFLERKSRRKTFDKPYPENMIDAICDTRHINDNSMRIPVVCAMFYASNKTNEIGSWMAHEYFAHGMTYEDLGELYGISKQRVGQIIHKYLRRVREAMDRIDRMMTAEEENENGIEILDLSLRAYNALKRADISTIEDIKSVEQLRQLRNVGEHTVYEIVEALKVEGYVIPEVDCD